MKKAIIIGATSGIGRQLAILLANKNYTVGITGRRKLLLEDIKKNNHDKFIIAHFDITDILETKKQLDNLVDKLGGLDLLILSSGTGDINTHLEFEIERKAIDVNVLGFTLIADWAINYFQKVKAT